MLQRKERFRALRKRSGKDGQEKGAPLGNMNAVKFGFNIDYGYRLIMTSIEEKFISEGTWSLEKVEEIAKSYRGKPYFFFLYA